MNNIKNYQMTNYQLQNNATNVMFGARKEFVIETTKIGKELGIPAAGTLAAMIGVNLSSKNNINVNENDSSDEQLETRKKSALEKMESLIDEWSNSQEYIDKNYCAQPYALRRSLWLPVYKAGCNKSANYSEICPQSMGLLEKFLDNSIFHENHVLRADTMKKIIEDFVEAQNIKEGVKFKDDINERAEKVNMIMDAYLKNKDAQNSVVMRDSIGYMMYRGANVSKGIVQEAVDIISDSKLCNDKNVVDEILYKMDFEYAPASPYANDKELQERLDYARQEIDKLDGFRHSKMFTYKKNRDYNEFEINSINLPVVEKFLNNKEFNQNKEWIYKITYIICDLNNNAFLMRGIPNTNKKVEMVLNMMNEYLSDKEAHSNKEKTAEYIKAADKILSWAN